MQFSGCWRQGEGDVKISLQNNTHSTLAPCDCRYPHMMDIPEKEILKVGSRGNDYFSRIAKNGSIFPLSRYNLTFRLTPDFPKNTDKDFLRYDF